MDEFWKAFVQRVLDLNERQRARVFKLVDDLHYTNNMFKKGDDDGNGN